jgi:hypothetical protein
MKPEKSKGPWPTTLPAAIGVVVVSMAVLSVQDYFDHHSLVFTAVYIVLVAAALALIFISPAGARPESPGPRAPEPWAMRAAALAWTAMCAALTYLPGFHSRLVIAAVVIAGSVLSAVMLLFQRGTLQASALPALASYILMVSSPVLYMEHQIYPERTVLFNAGMAACYALAAAPTLVRMPPAVALGLYLAAGTFLRGLGIYQWEMDPAHRDMIPLIHHGALSFLDGHNPYRLYFCDHDLPLTYMPLLWLTYVPAVWAGIEPRIVSVLFSIGTAVLIYLWRDRGGGSAGLFLFMAAVWFFQTEVLWVAMYAESAPYWFFAFLVLWAASKGKRAAAALALGLMLPTRQFSLLFVPFLLLWFLLPGPGPGGGRGTGGWKHLAWGNLIYPALAACIASVVITPFVIGSPLSYFFGTLHWLTSFGPTHRTWWDVAITLSPLFYEGRHEKLLPWIQAATYGVVFAGFLVFAVRRKLDARWMHRNVWPFLAAAYIVFLFFNSLIWRYLHLMGLALLLFSAGVRVLDFPLERRDEGLWAGAMSALRRTAVRRAAAWMVIAALTGTGTFLFVRGMVGFFKRGDMVESAAEVTGKLRPGDLLVDYVYFNAWPVLEGTPFPSAQFDPGIKHSVRLRSQFPPAFRRVLIVTSGNHFVYPGDAPDLAAYMKEAGREKVGRLNVVTLENPFFPTNEVGRLTQHFEWIRKITLASAEGEEHAVRTGEEEFKFPQLDPRYSIRPANLNIQIAKWPCVLAFPPQDMELRIDVVIPRNVRLWLATAVGDFSLWPGLSPVDIGVRQGKVKKHFSHPNEQGWYVWHAGSYAQGSTVELTVSSERQKRRFFCFDLIATE